MLNKFKLYLEEIKITPVNWLLGLSGVLMVRFFLESLSSPTSSGFFASDASTLIHYYLFFLSLFLIFIIIFEKVVPSWKSVAPQLIVVLSPVIFIAPIIDWLVSGGKGFKMTYFFDFPKDFLVKFLTLGGLDISVGATIGLKVEIALIVLFFGFFVYFIEKDWLKAVISSLGFYSIIFVFICLPSFISFVGQLGQIFPISHPAYLQKIISESITTLNNTHSSLLYSSTNRLFDVGFNFLMAKILFLISIGASFYWFRLNFKEKLKAMIENSRGERVLHYVLMIFLGFYVVTLMSWQ